LLPGPEAQQLATYVGWLLHGTRGGLVAGGLFVLPGFLAILLLSLLYAGFQDLPLLKALFFGIKAAVLAVVVDAVLRIGRRALKNGAMIAIAVAAFAAIHFADVPFPLIVVSAALLGLLGYRLDPRRFEVIRGHAASGAKTSPDIDRLIDDGHLQAPPALARSLQVTLFWSTLWLLPVAVLLAWLGPDDVFTQIGLFFSKLAVVTFGGAYAVLAYVAQQAVEHYGWLAPGEMLDGLGMAETTPGPLIMVLQFVAFLAAFRESTGLDPYLAGVLASLLATWVTFVPCFLWIFLGAPYVERLREQHALNAALSAVTAAVVGIILNLGVWFAMHTLFAEVTTRQAFGLRLQVPTLASIDPLAALLALAAAIALLRFKLGLFAVLGGCAVLGSVAYLLR
ncbi:MAG TPA: chromate transporter, partial [Arenimonas sp.]|nr:chromate transporter [Arenimonas sp.]